MSHTFYPNVARRLTELTLTFIGESLA